MVVNDDITQLNILSGLLRKDGIRVQSFDSADDAMAAMDRGCPPDLIVTDLYMPGIDGWRFCRLLRSPENAAFNQIPILIISATFAGEEAARITADLGANAFLSSPVDGKRFIESVKSLLSGERPREQLRVLIVEDNITAAGLLMKSFEQHGYHVKIATGMEQAADAFKRESFDVAVIDYHLPDGNGDELLAQFRNARPDVVCIMMTTDPSPELAIAWMRQGAAAYLKKPFEPEYLIELSTRARRERSLLRVQDLLEEKTRQLQERDQQLRNVLENSTNVFYTHTPEHVLTYLSPRIEVLLGCRPEEAMVEWTKLTTDNPANTEGLAITQKAIDTGLPQPPYLLELMHKTGRHVWVEINEAPVVENGSTVAIVGSLTDITERKQAEDARREAGRFAMETQCIARVGGWKANPHTDYLEWTEGIYEIVEESSEYRPSLAEGMKYFLPQDIPVILSKLAGCLSTGEPFTLETEIITAKGRQLWAELRGIAPVVDGERSAVIGTFQDITDRKQAEEEKVRLQEQLLQAQKMEAIGQLAGGVAHDFNNMLNIIIGYTQMALIKTEPSSPVNSNLKEILNAAQRSADLVRQLLAFARKQTIAPKVMDLNDIVAGMLNMLRRLIGEQIDLLWMPATDLWQVKMDPTQVDQIVANLAVNARDSISGAGKITIETGRAEFDETYCTQYADFAVGQYVMLEISDNGNGMDKDTKNKIFEPFFTTKEIGKGTGMGLATVYGIVKQNKGFINVESEPGKGATFKIYLPRFGKEETAINGSAPYPGLLTGTETVLLVEDDKALLNMAKMMLEELGYKVLTAGTPGEAIRLAGEYSSDIRLVVTDVVMPEMSGRDLQKRLKVIRPGMKYLFMSGYTANVIAHHGILYEGVNFIQKPFSMNVFATKVREVLAGRMN